MKRIVFTGGFTGAGKTAFLLEAARLLAQRGIKAGLVTNDGIAGQVDSAVLAQTGFSVREVKGSCLRCRFNGLADAIDALEEDLVLAEPMGGCADLSATILEPLRRYRGGAWALAPLSVLAAPERAAGILAGGNGGLHPSAAYIFRAQLEEADIILLSKCDAQTSARAAELCDALRAAHPRARVFPVSAHRRDGLAAWLDVVLGETSPGAHPAAIDYDRYAEGERVMAWANAAAALGGAKDWNVVAWRVMRLLRGELAVRRLPVAHAKLLLRAGEGLLSANFTASGEDPAFHGWLSESEEAQLTLNVRVQGEPQVLEEALRDVLAAACADKVRLDLREVCSGRPARPDPTYRFDAPAG